VERAEVLHRELLLESCCGVMDKLRAQGGEDDVVDVEQQVSSVGAIDEQRGVRLGLHEAQGDQSRRQSRGTMLATHASGHRGTC
jgi:hypothetical protein